MKLNATRLVLAVTLAAFLSVGTPRPAQAGLIGTATAIQSAAATTRGENLAHVEAALARADVRQQLQNWGVDATAASERVAALTDSELSQLASRIDTAPAGGEILALIGAVFLVLLILDYVGVTKIFHHR
jgi:hypothetical protein